MPVSRRYTSRSAAAGRFVSQRVLLKSLVHALVDVEVAGLDHVRALRGPFIAVSNHSSHLDAPLLLGSLPARLGNRVATGAAADYFFDSVPRRAFITTFFNGFPIDRGSFRDRRSLAGDLLEAGVPILVFPEGTRSRTGRMGTFSVGSAALSISRGVPILPAAVVGAFEAMPRGRRWPVRGRRPVHLVLGAPMAARADETPMAFSARVRDTVQEMFDAEAAAMGLPRQDLREAPPVADDRPTEEGSSDDQQQ